MISHSMARAVCSGDSFTYGYGVGNDQTWCARLAAINLCLDTVNLGQGGYGVDQAYLRYRRDAGTLDHDLHLFAFISSDFTRMRSDSFRGYGKPVLKLEDGALVVTNVPVPRRPWLAKPLKAVMEDVQDLRMFQAIDRARKRLMPDASADDRSSREATPDEVGALVEKVFEELKVLAVADVKKRL